MKGFVFSVSLHIATKPLVDHWEIITISGNRHTQAIQVPSCPPQHFKYCTKRHKVLKSSPFSQATSCCFFLQLSVGHLPQHPLVIEAWQRLPRTPTANPQTWHGERPSSGSKQVLKVQVLYSFFSYLEARRGNKKKVQCPLRVLGNPLGILDILSLNLSHHNLKSILRKFYFAVFIWYMIC